jgi:TM2 domain-containing membrane protein YozV
MENTAENSSEKDVSIADMVALEQELHELKAEHGIEENHNRVSRAITNFFDRREAKEAVMLNKKKYILLAIFTGWIGGHQFYAKHYLVAVLYLLLFWTGFGAAMTIIDLLIVIPKPVNENGFMTL